LTPGEFEAVLDKAVEILTDNLRASDTYHNQAVFEQHVRDMIRVATPEALAKALLQPRKPLKPTPKQGRRESRIVYHPPHKRRNRPVASSTTRYSPSARGMRARNSGLSFSR